ncbi:hypothetical protein SAMN06272735_7920 [Streptomyces sp. TLI_55]|uniref:hypothetical protein n=1 Tax=Streptomyces sp. TLI_55 TaxID=1938861 RepID=UPI000BCA9BCB|nr:hypothetical protein [Streptomyces sp. TLI_55]SNX66074.1 hypothetical protein SAMN06272735_7920 [Streptomyces sp. TLI_55]
MPDVREPVLPAPLRAVQILLLTLALAGIVSMLALSDGLTAYGQGELMAPWLLVWVNAALCLTYDGSARGGVRTTTLVLMTLVVLPTVTRLGEAASPGPFLDAALRLLLGVPVIVLLFLPESTAWFDRER